MNNDEILKKLADELCKDVKLRSDANNRHLKHESNDKRLYLAHYSSLSVLESILTTKEFWLSHPFFMNDKNELNLGLNKTLELLKDLQSDLNGIEGGKYKNFNQTPFDVFNNWLFHFSTNHFLDYYILCFSEIDPRDKNGDLTMWRAYGSNGSGAALILDANKFPVNDSSPFIFAKVEYMNETDIINGIKSKIEIFYNFLNNHDNSCHELYLRLNGVFFQRMLMASTFVKHEAFKAENEWRVVYYKDRDKNNSYENMCNHAVTAKGIEPKLKLNIECMLKIEHINSSFDDICDKIILGPTSFDEKTSYVQQMTLKRLLTQSEMPRLASRVFSSKIPYRS
jgi:Protein of unknown function (DUF2971)